MAALEQEMKEYILDAQDGGHGNKERRLVVGEKAVEDGVNVELVNTEAANEPLQSLS